jgi:hypothetical protein
VRGGREAATDEENEKPETKEVNRWIRAEY